jgi:hypothetical protein
MMPIRSHSSRMSCWSRGGEVLWTSAQLVAELRSVGRPRRRDVIVGGAGARSARTVSF